MPTATEEKPVAGAKETTKPAENQAQPDPGSASKFLSRFVGSDVKVEAPPPKPEDVDKDKKPEAGKDTKPALATKPEKKPKKSTPVAPVAAPLSTTDIATASAEGTTRALAEHMAKKPATEEPKIEFSPQETRRIAVLARMEKNKPEYKGTADRYKQSLIGLMEYAEKWEKDHPGKEFNQDDDEHKEFFEKNEIAWDDDDYAEALADLRVDEKIGTTKKELDEKFSKIEKSERRTAATPKIRESQVTSARGFYGQLGEQYKDLLQPNGTVNSDVLTKLQTDDPVATSFAIAGADTVETYARATYELFNDLTDFDPRNTIHSFLNNFILSNEKKLMEQPATDQLDTKGRAFLPAAEYHKKLQSNAAETQRRYWTFERADVDVLVRHVVLKQTKLNIEAANRQFETMAKARGIKLPDKPAPKPEAKANNGKLPPKTTKPELEEEAEEDDDKPKSPTARFAAPPVPGDKTATEDNTPVSRFAKKFLGA